MKKRIVSLILIITLLMTSLPCLSFSAGALTIDEQKKLYEGFIRSFGYLDIFYEDLRFETPMHYWYMDLDGNGVTELLIESQYGDGFCYTDIYTLEYGMTQVELTESIYSYGNLSYVPKGKSNLLCYSALRPTAMEGSVGFYKYENGKAKISSSIHHEVYDGSPKYTYNSYDEYGNTVERYQITEAKRSEIMNQRVYPNYISLYDQTEDGLLYRITDDEVVVAGYTGYDSEGELTIPSHIEGYPVTSICAMAFCYTGSFLEKIEIPDTVKKIGYGAFLRSYDLQTVKFKGSKTKWNQIVIEDNNDYLLEATLKTEYDPDEYRHGYAELIHQAMMDTEATYPDFEYIGYGELEDIDGNGVKELIMSYFIEEDGTPTGVCSVYTIKNNVPIPLIEEEELYKDIGGPSGSCNIVTKNGKKYLAVTAETGETGYNATRTGYFKLYRVDGESIVLETDVTYKYKREGEYINYNDSYAVINGEKCSYSKFEELQSSYEILNMISPYYGYEALPLEIALERTLELEIQESEAIEIYSDRVELSVGKGEKIIVGAGIVQDGERVTDVSMLSCSVSDPSVLSAISTTTKENCRIYTFDALSPGVTYITFSDSKTGLVKKVPITVYDKNVMAYTISSVSTQKIDKYTTNFYNVNGLYVDSYTYTENKDGSAVLKFDVYNTNYTYGAVEVFNKDGIMQDAVVIEKMTNNGDSLKSTLWDNTLCMVRDTRDWDWLSYRQESGFSKKTPVEVKVPKDGYIKITVDAADSFLVALINGLDIAMSIKSVYGELDGFDVNSKLFAEELTAELVRNAAYAEFIKDGSEYVKYLTKNVVKKTTVFSGESMGKFADSFVNNLSELKLEELIWDMAGEFGWSTGQSLFEYFSGPVGAAMKGMFMFGEICNFIVQANDYTNYMFSESIVIQNQGGYNRVSSQVKVSSETAFGNEVALRAFEVSVNSSEYENIKTFNPELYREIVSVPSQVYNISMIKNGVETQPEGKVEVSIPVPENMKHLARNGKIKVYRIEENGSRTEMQVKVQNGLLIFSTDHFSLYVIMGDEILGDVDGDGEVTIMDATEVQLAVAKVITLSEDRNRCADADRDGETTIMDATQIQKFVARVITQL